MTERDPLAWWVLAEDGKTPVPLDVIDDYKTILRRELELERVQGRLVARYAIAGYVLSTVVLIADPSFRYGPPLLWETALWTRQGRGYHLRHLVKILDRYPSWDDAVSGHHRWALELSWRYGPPLPFRPGSWDSFLAATAAFGHLTPPPAAGAPPAPPRPGEPDADTAAS